MGRGERGEAGCHTSATSVSSGLPCTDIPRATTYQPFASGFGSGTSAPSWELAGGFRIPAPGEGHSLSGSQPPRLQIRGDDAADGEGGDLPAREAVMTEERKSESPKEQV